MQVDVKRLKDEMSNKNVTPQTVAKSIGSSRATFYRKLKSQGETFTIGDVYKIIACLQLDKSKAIEIFIGN